jgi:hypothetical protein
MMNNKQGAFGLVAMIIIAVVIIGGGAYFLMNSDSSEGEGRVVFAITDAAAEMGTISEVRVTIDSIEAHSTQDSWTTVSSESQEYDLLELKAKGQLAIMADEEIEAGSYDQFRMKISKVVIVDSEGEHEAKLPSGELKINTAMDIDSNSTATATFDFIADESIHVTGNGKYIMAPVIQIEVREDATVESNGSNTVIIRGGQIRSNSRVGMDINGNVGVGLSIPASAQLDIDLGGVKISNGAGIGVGIGSSGSASSNNSSASGSGGVGVGVGSSGGVSGSGSASGGY